MSFAPLLGLGAIVAAALAAQSTIAPSPTEPRRSPGEIAAAAPAGDWVRIADDDLLVMELAPASTGQPPRRVVIELLPKPISQRWIGNIRKLAVAHWWDGTSVNRVQDNYVAQWGDATEKKPLPSGLATVSERDYDTDWTELDGAATGDGLVPVTARPSGDGTATARAVDVYAPGLLWYRGFPLATDMRPVGDGRKVWPVHCYGMVGVGRNLSPDTGSGAELYAVIGHAPRHLDRNIALVGRVIEGIEQLSSLPRGTAALGFYDKPEQRVAIVRVRLASELPEAERPHYAYLDTRSETWLRYAAARRNREPPFFTRPADAADVCNIPVPVKALP